MATIEINCKDVWREISNYIENDVEPQLRQRLEAHFMKCNHCSAILDGTRNVLRLVGDGQAFDLPAGFTQRLRDRLSIEEK